MPIRMRTVLFSTYELGRQSFGLGSAAAWLRQAGAEVEMHDLALCSFEPAMVEGAGFVGVHLPMHTATRLAEGVLRRVAAVAPAAHVACFGLYAPMNEARLREVGADTILGGEFERDLVAAWRAVAGGGGQPNPATGRSLRFLQPDRVGLPGLERYGQMQPASGARRVTGYTEATRGCKHLCRHCPVVPVYQGRFVVVEPDVVLADIRAQVDAGARHITFGDPDFFNGPAHALRVVRRLHDEFPDLTYDVTIKVEHLRTHSDLLAELAATGCILVTSAVESFDEAILDRFDKGHTAADLEAALAELRRVGLPINPTFVTFTPWTTIDGYLGLLARVAELGLVGNVAPIQYAIRLLIPAGSLLLELDEVAALVDPFDDTALVHPWRHPDPRMDRLHQEVLAIARGAGTDRTEVFRRVWTAARAVAGDRWPVDPPLDEAVPVATVPYLTEPWYC
jgi:hypothetical protein